MSANIIDTYPRKRTIWEAAPEMQPQNWRNKRLRVAIYIRVSTDSEDQLNSFEGQRAYYEEFVKQHPNWKYAALYFDEGVSGTSKKKRIGFQKMLEDCRNGMIDLIVVKDVSRFARNTTDCIESVRELLRLDPPVGIYFDTIGINTLDVGTQLILSIFAMFAQMESELKSENVKIGLEAKKGEGKYLCPAENLLGFNKVQKYDMEIEPKGAKAVELIYKQFLSGMPCSQIAEIMKSINVPTGGDCLNWTTQNVKSILSNEKYCGGVFVQKEYIEDIFTRRAIKNTGRRRMIYEPKHHNAIVSEAEHYRALLLLKANYSSPCFNLNYDIKVIRSGILSGFIPLNTAFGWYESGHYLGAITNAKIPPMPTSDQPIRVTKSLPAEMFNPQNKECITIAKSSIKFNKPCVKYMNCSHVELLLHPHERLIAVRKTTTKNPNAIQLGTNSISTKINKILCDLMGWNRNDRHNIVADIFVKNDESVLLFNLDEKRQFFARMSLAQNLDKWETNAKATAVNGFNTCVPSTPTKELEKLTQEVENSYVGWQPPEKRRKRKTFQEIEDGEAQDSRQRQCVIYQT